eukprot:scaffold7946_cov403-Prasinococcus_capsulatus_cf.AAC.8
MARRSPERGSRRWGLRRSRRRLLARAELRGTRGRQLPVQHRSECPLLSGARGDRRRGVPRGGGRQGDSATAPTAASDDGQAGHPRPIAGAAHADGAERPRPRRPRQGKPRRFAPRRPTGSSPRSGGVDEPRLHLVLPLQENQPPASEGAAPAEPEVLCCILGVDDTAHTVEAVAPGAGLREFAFDRVFGQVGRERGHDDDGNGDATAAVNMDARLWGSPIARPLLSMVRVACRRQRKRRCTSTARGGWSWTLSMASTPRCSCTARRGPARPIPCSVLLTTSPEWKDATGAWSLAPARTCSGWWRPATAWDCRAASPSVWWRCTATRLRICSAKAEVWVNPERLAKVWIASRYVLDGRAQVEVASHAEIQDLISKGNAIKRRAATAMNDRSSRAHTLLFLTLATSYVVPEQGSAGDRCVERVSRLCLADLGGSEKLSKSKAHEGALGAGKVPWTEYYASRSRLNEATAINSGLFALKRCMESLNRISAGDSGVSEHLLHPMHEHLADIRHLTSPAQVHIPFQDSKLTLLLSSALGGDSRTGVVVTASQAPRHAIESVQSLRFGEQCRT